MGGASFDTCIRKGISISSLSSSSSSSCRRLVVVIILGTLLLSSASSSRSSSSSSLSCLAFLFVLADGVEDADGSFAAAQREFSVRQINLGCRDNNLQDGVEGAAGLLPPTRSDTTESSFSKVYRYNWKMSKWTCQGWHDRRTPVQISSVVVKSDTSLCEYEMFESRAMRWWISLSR